MPTYGYECKACEDQFEIFQSIKDDALSTCEKCGGNLRKRIYPVGISFKGSGFYVNDYAGAGKAAATASETSSSVEGATPNSEKAVSAETAKPAATPAAAAAPAATS